MKWLTALALFPLAAPFAQNYTVTLPDSICTATMPVVWEKKVPQYCEGPAYETSTGFVYFTEQAGGANWPIWKIRPGTADTGIHFVTTRQNNGLEFDPQGRLVAAEDGRIARFTSTGALDSVLVASGQNGVSFNQANDLTIGANGGIYFTALGTDVYYLSSTRQLSVAATGLASANGIEWMDETPAVFVNQATSAGQVTRFSVGAKGALTNPTIFARMPVPDGGTLDSHGNHYVASYQKGEVQVFNANGDSLGFIRLSFASGMYDKRSGATGNADNCVFGGPANTILYMTGDGGLYSIQLKIPGRLRISTAVQKLSLQPVPVKKYKRVDFLGRSNQSE